MCSTPTYFPFILKVLATSCVDAAAIHWSFPLIQAFFVKLTQLAQFDKTSHVWQYIELVIV